MKNFVWDTPNAHIHMDDPCGCALCKRIQEAVNRRNPLNKLAMKYAEQEKSSFWSTEDGSSAGITISA